MGDRYEKLQPLAAGGMGEVFLARDSTLEREVALKQISGDNPELNTMFLNEARVMGALEHPNIVPVHDLGQDDAGRPYLTMQYVRGETLAGVIERLRNGNPEAHQQFSFPRRLRLIQQVCEALSYAHSRGVLHRDIKPANIMLGSFGEVIVVDWGLSAPIGKHLGDEENSAMTPAYAAPERIELDRCDERSEVYSVGAVMYELMSLTLPFDGSMLELLNLIVKEEPRPPDDYLWPAQGRVPREVANIIMRALAKDPTKRHQSARDLAEAIQDYLDGEAPVVCVHTGFKRLLNSLARLVDDHGHLVIISSVTGLMFFGISYGVLIWLAL